MASVSSAGLTGNTAETIPLLRRYDKVGELLNRRVVVFDTRTNARIEGQVVTLKPADDEVVHLPDQLCICVPKQTEEDLEAFWVYRLPWRDFKQGSPTRSGHRYKILKVGDELLESIEFQSKPRGKIAAKRGGRLLTKQMPSPTALNNKSKWVCIVLAIIVLGAAAYIIDRLISHKGP